MTHYRAIDMYTSICSDICRNCSDHGEVIANNCECGERHIWCEICWQLSDKELQ